MSRVGFLHHSLGLGGGSERVVADLVTHIDQQRLEPVVYCMYEPGALGEQLSRAGIPVRAELFTRPLRPWRLSEIAKFGRLVDQDDIDLLYTTDGLANTIVGALVARRGRSPMSALAFHSYDTVLRQGATRPKKLAMGAVDRIFHPLFDRYVALSESHRDYLVTVKRLAGERIGIAHNGVELAKFAQPSGADGLRERLGLPIDAPLVVTVAGLRRWKRHDLLIKAIADLSARGVDVHLVLAGDGPERTSLETQVDDLDIRDSVRFLGTIDYVPALLQIATVVVLPSEHEAFPISLLEAMASGLPVVATEVGSVADVVVDGVTGLVVPPHSTGDLSTAIATIVGDPDRAALMGRAGRQRAQELFDLQSTVDRFEDLVEGWIEESRTGAGSSVGGGMSR